MGGAVETFAEKEPGDDAAEHPEDKGDITGRLGFEADLKDYPEDGHIDRRVDERPENTEVGAEILAAKILFGQFQYHLTALEEIFGKKEENTEIIHGGIILDRLRRVKTRKFPSGNGAFSPWRRQSSVLLVRRTVVRPRAIR